MTVIATMWTAWHSISGNIFILMEYRADPFKNHFLLQRNMIIVLTLMKCIFQALKCVQQTMHSAFTDLLPAVPTSTVKVNSVVGSRSPITTLELMVLMKSMSRSPNLNWRRLICNDVHRKPSCLMEGEWGPTDTGTSIADPLHLHLAHLGSGSCTHEGGEHANLQWTQIVWNYNLYYVVSKCYASWCNLYKLF